MIDIDRIICSNDLLEIAEHLLNFIELAPKKRDFNLLDSRMRSLIVMNGLFYPIGKTYSIHNRLSPIVFLDSVWVRQSTANENIEQLKNIAMFINDKFTESKNVQISESSVSEIMEYLNLKFSFYDAVLKSNPIEIVMLNNTHVDFNNECFAYGTDGEVDCKLFVYHLKENSSYSPEYVFLHELGHVVHIKLTGKAKSVPNSFFDCIASEFPDMTLHTAPEIFADCFAMAVMHESPFSKYDPFDKIKQEHKVLFKQYMKSLILSAKGDEKHG